MMRSKITQKVKVLLLFIFIFSTFFPLSSSIKQTHAAGIQGDAAATYAATNNLPSTPEFGCNFTNIATLQDGVVASCAAAMTWYIFLKPTYIVASWVSILLNYVVNTMVIGMGTLYKEIESGVLTAWRVLRDLANVFLVFLTIYVGVAVVLGVSKYGDKKMLWKIILAALLVNFSITFTKIVIDVSNLATMEIYKNFLTKANDETLANKCAEPNDSAENMVKVNSTDECIDKGLAMAFWNELKITTLFNINSLSATTTTSGSTKGSPKSPDIGWALFFMVFMGGIMCIVMAFVFGAAAFLLVARFVILIFLIIVSPVALVALLTNASSLGATWWKKLIDQSFFAPLLLLMWWIAFQVLSGYTKMLEGQQVSANVGLITKGSGSMGIIVMFMVVIAFLILGLVVAKQMGAHGASGTIKFGKFAAAAGGGFVAANTLGRASAFAQRKHAERMAKAQEIDEDGYYKDTTLRGYAMRKLANGRIDRAVNAGLGAGANTKFAGRSSFVERKLANQKNASARQEEIAGAGAQAGVRNAMNIVNDPQVQKDSTEYKTAQKIIRNASQARIEQLRAEHGSKANTQAMRETYSKKQALALANKPDTTPEQKKALIDHSYHEERTAMRTAVAGTPTSENIKTLKGMSHADVVANKDLMRSNPKTAVHFSTKTFNEIVENKNEDFDGDTIEQAKTAREEHFGNMEEAEIAQYVKTEKSSDLAAHSTSFLGRPEFIKNIDVQTLSEMHRSGFLTKEKKDAMKVATKTLFDAILETGRREGGGGSTLVNQHGRPINTEPERTPEYSEEQKNIIAMHNWLNNAGRPSA